MSYILKLAVLAAAFAGWLFATHNTDPYRAVCGVTGLVVVAIIALLLAVRSAGQTEKMRRRRPSSVRRQRGIKESGGQAVVKALGYGLLFVLFANTATVVLARTPFYSVFYDTNFARLESKLEDTEAVGTFEGYQKALQIAEGWVDRPDLSGKQKNFLVEKKMDYLLKMAEKSSDSKQVVNLLLEAKDWGEKNGLGTKEQLAIARLQVYQPTPTTVPTQTPYPTQTPRPTYTAVPTIYVQVTATPIPVPTPKVLPAGTTAQVVLIKKESTVLSIDLLVKSPQGYVTGLSATDVRVKLGGVDISQQNIALQSYQSMPQPKYVTVVFDRSGSMEGTPLKIAKDAAKLLVQNLRDVDKVRIIAFSDNVDVSGWMDPNSATKVVDSIQASGNTSLWDAIVSGGKDVVGYPHILVILTDGNDNRSKSTLAAAMQGAQGSMVYAVGIISTDFNPNSLQELCQKVSGKYLPATVDTLKETFAQISGETQNLYRLTIFAPQGYSGETRVTFGQGQVEVKF